MSLSFFTASLVLGCSNGFFGKNTDPEFDTGRSGPSDQTDDTGAEASADDTGEEQGEEEEPDPADVDDDGDGTTENEGDCDDTDSSVGPGSDEIYYDGIDNDCDESTVDDDADGDGSTYGDDCDDTDASAYPGADEDRTDGVDNDCDGDVDERFEVETVDADHDGGYPSALDVTSDGDVHIVYQDRDSGSLYWARLTSATWSAPAEIVSGGTSGEWMDAKMDSQDRLQLAFTWSDGGTQELYFAFLDSGVWYGVYVVDDASITGSSSLGHEVSIDIDSSDLPSFTYYVDEHPDHVFGFGIPTLAETSSWLGEVLYLPVDYQLTGNAGEEIALAIDNDGFDHVLYYDDGWTAGEMQYSGVGADLNISLSQTAWDGEAADISMDVGTDNEPCASFYAVSAGDLMYGCYDGSNWSFEQVDASGDVGLGSAMVLDGDEPWIAYYDESNGDLKVAHKDASGWELFTVDSEGDVGQQPSIALGDDGRVHVSYYDASKAALKYAVGR